MRKKKNVEEQTEEEEDKEAMGRWRERQLMKLMKG